MWKTSLGPSGIGFEQLCVAELSSGRVTDSPGRESEDHLSSVDEEDGYLKTEEKSVVRWSFEWIVARANFGDGNGSVLCVSGKCPERP